VTVCILPLVEISLPQQHRFDKHRKKVAGDFLTGPMHSEAPKVEPSKKAVSVLWINEVTEDTGRCKGYELEDCKHCFRALAALCLL
jgi:hypothetical protein